MRARAVSVIAAACIGLGGSGRATADEEAPVAAASESPTGRARPVLVSAAVLAGTGYGWRTSTGEVNADVPFSGGSWARLGHVLPEIAMLFEPQRLFVSFSVRWQIVTGTTDVYALGTVFHARTSARSLSWKVGWFPRRPEERLQPFISFGLGRGEIAHAVSTPSLRNCGPAQDQLCVDTITVGPNLAGPGTGLRWRVTEHADVVFGVDTQLGFRGFFHDRGYNMDANLGVAAVF